MTEQSIIPYLWKINLFLYLLICPSV